MSVLRLNDYATRRVMRENKLDKLPRLGRGAFALVFEAEDGGAWKLTTDALQRDSQLFYLAGPWFPEVLEDRGYQGEQSNGAPVYLYKVERLQPLRKAAPALRKEAQQLLALVQKAQASAWKTCRQRRPAASLVLEAALGEGNTGVYQRPLEQLLQFSRDYENVAADFHQGNLMVRDGNQLVLNDVLCDASWLQ